MTYSDFFYDFKQRFDGVDVSDIQEHLAYQFNIEDEEAGGIFYAEVKEGQLYIEPYDYHDRDAIFYTSPSVLLDIIDGKIDPVDAFTDQKLRLDGDIDKALRLKELIEMKGAAVIGKKDDKKTDKATDKK